MDEIIIVENGENVIDVVWDGFITCLKIKKPIAFDKYEYCTEKDSAKQFWLNYDHEKIDDIYNFDEILIYGNNEEIKKEIYSFLNIFLSGRYEVKLENWILSKFELHKDYHRIQNTTNFCYNYENYRKVEEPHNVMFTIPYSDISFERVKFYKELIEKGIRPKIITIICLDVVFILDGHHKYLAYMLANVPAAVISIKKKEDDSEEAMLDLFLNCQFMMSDEEKKYFISEQPFLCDDVSDKALRYNIEFDKYLLEFYGGISSCVFRLILKSILSDKEEEKDWGLKKLAIVGNRDFENEVIFLDKILEDGMISISSERMNSKEQFESHIKALLSNTTYRYFD
ncbi:hypothetical protein SGQ83_00875 [Flavobacterium sp. Fl-318]|uniref:DGQHR domain-containing protein n=1 Tax=Flavobacterium cupriresistens TaxID=2893885 RepID=A0ABU4R5M9_9FLAO|nr:MULTISPECIES: hypothetical protein [unclassified Flavobacterium]MDX6187889.1 hypothetical protein [Flavobacterium sp. Fl-318]UFH42191.1 hypothetical protein LNP23_20575 [Flavobacterium sp. F-323]